jgi:hypothetical protein
VAGSALPEVVVNRDAALRIPLESVAVPGAWCQPAIRATLNRA